MNRRSIVFFAGTALAVVIAAAPPGSVDARRALDGAHAKVSPAATSLPTAASGTFTPGPLPTTQAPVPYQGFPGTNTVPPLQQGGGRG